MDLLEEKGSIFVATFSITRDITLTEEDFEKIQASKSTDLLLDIIKKNTDKQEQPSLLGLEKLVR